MASIEPQEVELTTETLTLDKGTVVEILNRLARIENKTDALRAYVEQIEKEAHEAMGGLTDPDNMMKMAGQFLGMNPRG